MIAIIILANQELILPIVLIYGKTYCISERANLKFVQQDLVIIDSPKLWLQYHVQRKTALIVSYKADKRCTNLSLQPVAWYQNFENIGQVLLPRDVGQKSSF